MFGGNLVIKLCYFYVNFMLVYATTCGFCGNFTPYAAVAESMLLRTPPGEKRIFCYKLITANVTVNRLKSFMFSKQEVSFHNMQFHISILYTVPVPTMFIQEEFTLDIGLYNV